MAKRPPRQELSKFHRAANELAEHRPMPSSRMMSAAYQSEFRPIAPLREPDHLDTTIYALLRHLPPPGAVWPETERQKWLETMHQTFTLVYRESADSA